MQVYEKCAFPFIVVFRVQTANASLWPNFEVFFLEFNSGHVFLFDILT